MADLQPRNDRRALTLSGANATQFTIANTGTCVAGSSGVTVAAGVYSLTAVATDSNNLTATSAAVNVTVSSAIPQAYYIHTDQLDTPRVITDTNGNVVWQWDNSDPFGNNMANENPNGAGAFNFNLRFPGQYYDRETNLHYNINRDYDPSIGRYIQSDPLGLGGGQFSTYAYVR